MQSLRNLESKYLSALANVQELIRMEGGEIQGQSKSTIFYGSTREIPVPSGGNRNENSVKFEDMTKGDAAEFIFNELGKDMIKDELFKEMKKRGHPLSSIASLTSLLSTHKRFSSKGKRKWGLKQPDLIHGAHERNGF